MSLIPAVANIDVLRRLAREPAPETVAALARDVNRDPDNLRKTLKGVLERFGLVEGLALTEAGREAIAKIARIDAGEGHARAEVAPLPGFTGLRWAQIMPDPLNPRTDFDSEAAKEALAELAADVKAHGLLQNLVVRPSTIDSATLSITDANGVRLPLYDLVAGERRWRAIGLLVQAGDWPADRLIPAQVVEIDDRQHRVLALVENLKRRDLNAVEEARAFRRLIDHAGMGTADIAAAINATQRVVQQRLQLLELDDKDLDQLASGQITIEEARRRIQAKNALVLKLEPDALLLLAEIADAADGDERRRAEVADEIPEAELEVLKSLGGGGGLWLVSHTHRHWEDARSYATLDWNTLRKIEATLPGWGDPIQRAAHLHRLRAEVAGADVADARRRDGRYVTEWLNGPFEPPAEVVAERAAEEARRKENDRRREEAEAFAKETSAARMKRIEEVRGWLQQTVLNPVLPEVAELAESLRSPLPWWTDGEVVVAANGARVDLGHSAWNDNVRAQRLLTVIAVNAAAGLATPTDRPAQPQAEASGADESDDDWSDDDWSDEDEELDDAGVDDGEAEAA